MLSPASLGRRQVVLYLIAAASGLGVGAAWPSLGPGAGALLWPVLGSLLFVTFTQVPLLHVKAAFADRRFAVATLAGQFVLLPALVLLGVRLLPDDPVLRLGVLLVLLVPCTDWVVGFTALAGGDAARAVAVSPLNLLLQLVLLPVYLSVAGAFPAGGVALADALAAAAVLLVPLLLAAAIERWVEAVPRGAVMTDRLARLPVPLLALVIGLVATAQADDALAAGPVLPLVVPVFVAFLVVALGLAVLVARVLRLRTGPARTLAFGYGTRNSFLVLPVALALPAGWEPVAVVVVVQSVVELLGMVVYLRLVPRLLP